MHNRPRSIDTQLIGGICYDERLDAIVYGFTGKFFWKTGEKAAMRTYRPLTEEEAAKLAK